MIHVLSLGDRTGSPKPRTFQTKESANLADLLLGAAFIPPNSRMTQPYRFELLAPTRVPEGCCFSSYSCNPAAYLAYLKQMQTLRGTAYLEDGAIKCSDLDEYGRFHMPGDEQSWHLLLIDNCSGDVIGCARYFLYSNIMSFSELRISHSAVATDAATGPAIRRMIEADIELATAQGLTYVEIGGWAVMRKWRRTRTALNILGGSYALGELWGGCVGICTATFRHGSASILRKFSGSTSATNRSPFAVYYDPQYECPMEVLRFDRVPSRRFVAFIPPVKQMLLRTVPLTYEPMSDSYMLPLVA